MKHPWQFFRAGGVDQVSIRNGADILALSSLDKKLWIALAMPTREISIDPRTLELLDHDKDGRIRVPDILIAIEWIRTTWSSADDLLTGGDELQLTSIQDGPVLAAARRALIDLGKKGAITISLADAVKAVEALASTRLNGDGVIVADTADDDDTRAAIEEVIAALGSVADRSGKPGVDQATLDRFFVDVDKIAAWAARPELEPDLRCLGDRTEAAADALIAVRAKLDDYFTRGRLTAFDARATAGLNGQDTDFTALGGQQLSASAADLAKLPLARIDGVRPAPLTGPVNPAWAARLAELADRAVTPILGARQEITEAELATLVARLAPFEAWRTSRPATAIAALSVDRVRALAAPAMRARLGALVAADRALEADYAAIASVEKLLRFQRDFVRILRNFVNFSDFYSDRNGAFQIGTLYLDGRACQLCVPVADAAKHGSLASLSGAYLLYCDLTRGSDKRAIAAVMSNGDSDNLLVGRNGVFYDRDGRDWDATVARIVTNPISVREAFWAPYKKLARMIDEQIAKRATAADGAATAKVEGAAATVANADQAAAAPAPPRQGRRVDVGTVAAIGVAIGGIGAMVVGLLAAFLGLGLWMPIGIVALLLLISGPSMVLAWLKLRQRNLGPILDANGWALNGRARVSVAFGHVLTDLATLPPGAKRSMDDPYADKATHWRLYTFIIVVLLLAGTWYLGKLDRYLPRAVRSTSVLGDNAPAAPKVDLKAPSTPAPVPAA